MHNAPAENREVPNRNTRYFADALAKLLPEKLEAMKGLKPASEKAKEQYETAQDSMLKRYKLLQTVTA